MTVCVVVARYNEDVNWTKAFPNVLVYNKGAKMPDFDDVLLDNVGREGHTYYKHICDNYDRLADHTVFLQGNPFDHSPNVLRNLTNYTNKELHLDFEFLSERVLNCNLSGCKHHSGLPLIETYEKLFGVKKRELQFQFGAGAQFVVSKQRILKRPKEFYRKIVDLLEKSANPIEGFVIERFHSLIFS